MITTLDLVYALVEAGYGLPQAREIIEGIVAPLLRPKYDREIDPSVVELFFDCPQCPRTRGFFQMRVSVEEYEQMNIDKPVNYVCPRGHQQTWSSFRCSNAVDTAGYSFGIEHAAEQVVAYLASPDFETYRVREGKLNFLSRQVLAEIKQGELARARKSERFE